MAYVSSWHDNLGISSPIAVSIVVGMVVAAVSSMVLPNFHLYPQQSTEKPEERDWSRWTGNETSPMPEEKVENDNGEEDADISFTDWISLCVFGDSALSQLVERQNKRINDEKAFSQPAFKHPVDGILGAVGNSPLIRIASLSDATGCEMGHC